MMSIVSSDIKIISKIQKDIINKNVNILLINSVDSLYNNNLNINELLQRIERIVNDTIDSNKTTLVIFGENTISPIIGKILSILTL